MKVDVSHLFRTRECFFVHLHITVLVEENQPMVILSDRGEEDYTI